MSVIVCVCFDVRVSTVSICWIVYMTSGIWLSFQNVCVYFVLYV